MAPLRLSALNWDVQRHIISFLSSPSDLVALRSTSVDFVDLTTSALCAVTKDMPLRCGADIVAFYRFLRTQDPSSRTADLVKDLRFQLERPSSQDDPNYHQLPDPSEDEVVEAFTGTLDHCRHLHHLHMIQWEPQVPPSLLFHTLSNLTLLEELVINLDEDVEAADLLQLASLPLRRLACLCAPRMAPQFGHFAAFGSLAGTLVELDLPLHAHKCKSLGATFAGVRKLGLWVPRGHAFVNDVHASFPNISHLTLHGQCPWTHRRGMWVVEGGEATNEAVRREHVEQREERTRGIWPSLTVIRVEDPRTAYILGLDRPITSLSLTWLTYTPEFVFQTAVGDIRPTCLEFVLDFATYMGSMSVGGGPYVALSQLVDLPEETVSSLRHLVVYLRRFTMPSLCINYQAPIHLLASALDYLPITHLVIKLDLGPDYLDIISRDPTNAIAGYSQDSCWYNHEDGMMLLDAAEAWATLIAETSSTLEWVIVYVPRDRVRCWEITRQAGGEEGEWDAAMWEMDEDEAWRVLSAESLREFVDSI